jgi:hypothetical protein
MVTLVGEDGGRRIRASYLHDQGAVRRHTHWGTGLVARVWQTNTITSRKSQKKQRENLAAGVSPGMLRGRGEDPIYVWENGWSLPSA